MANNRVLDEQTIGDILLCDPITRKGKESLAKLGLTTQDVSPSFFYNNLRAASKYDVNNMDENEAHDQADERNCLYYQYTVDYEQFKSIKERLKEFNTRFESDLPNQYPLLMLGVAGNGKSIEVNRRIVGITPGDTEFECGKAYFNLEDAFTKKTYGVTYECPDQNDSLWLFCIKLLDGIMQYIKHCQPHCSTILYNFNNIIVKENLANEEQKTFFRNIGNYNGDDVTETPVFGSLINLLKSQQADKDIKTLLEILMLVMFCSAPDKKHYIVIDNVEQYIKLNEDKIQIPNSDLITIYKAINEVVTNITIDFDRIEENLGWKAFKIIIVLRRTSIGFLNSNLLQSPVKGDLNINDVTGHIQIPDIWVKKKEHIWNKKLKDKFNDIKNEKIINIVDCVINDGEQAIGTSYQSIIAPLMSYGIRRNAKAQAHAAYKTYEILTNGDNVNINLEEFNKLLSVAGNSNASVRYMFRRALIEFQFKWSISSGNKNRWRKLGIGHLKGEKERSYNKTKFMIERVDYYNAGCVTLARRILTYLSCFPDENSISENGRSKLVTDMFATIPLFNLIKGVLINPVSKNTISEDDFLQFARVLIALSDMSNDDTRSAPYVILGIKDKNFHRDSSEAVLAQLLKKIWEAGPEKSLPEEMYNCSDYGVRITDAGNSFLLDWQASFSFMAALHCFTVPALFFLKDISSIKYVIETVYNASLELCNKYESEARRFCGNNVTLKRGTFLPKHNGEYITFKQRVQELHMNHLKLYRDFIGTNYSTLGITESNMLELTARNSGFISKYIAKYNDWEIGEGASECF